MPQENIEQDAQKPDTRQVQESSKATHYQTNHNNASLAASPYYHDPINKNNQKHGFAPNHQKTQQNSGQPPQSMQKWPFNYQSSRFQRGNLIPKSFNSTNLTANIGRELGTLQRMYHSDMQY